MPGFKQTGEQSRDVNNNITIKELQPWTKAPHKKSYLGKASFLAFEVHMFYNLEVLHMFFFPIIETCELDKSSWCCLKQKQKHTAWRSRQKPSGVLGLSLFPVHSLLLWLAYGKPNWEIIMLEYFKGMPS